MRDTREEFTREFRAATETSPRDYAAIRALTRWRPVPLADIQC